MKFANLFSFAALLLLPACSWMGPGPDEPVFPAEISEEHPDRSKKQKDMSKAYSMLGWERIKKFEKSGDITLLNWGIRNFNSCWKYNPNNYSAYWGIGVIRGIQAVHADSPELTEKYFGQSLEFLAMTRKFNLTPEERNRLEIHYFTLCNRMAEYYLKAEHFDESADAVQRGWTAFETIRSANSDNGKVFALAAENRFLAGMFLESRALAVKAIELGHPVPKEVAEGLGID